MKSRHKSKTLWFSLALGVFGALYANFSCTPTSQGGSASGSGFTAARCESGATFIPPAGPSACLAVLAKCWPVWLVLTRCCFLAGWLGGCPRLPGWLRACLSARSLPPSPRAAGRRAVAEERALHAARASVSARRRDRGAAREGAVVCAHGAPGGARARGANSRTPRAICARVLIPGPHWLPRALPLAA